MGLRSRMRASPTHTDGGISSAPPAATSCFGSAFWGAAARQGGSGGLTGGRMMTGFSPGGRTLLKLSKSPGREEDGKNWDGWPYGTVLVSSHTESQVPRLPPSAPISFWSLPTPEFLSLSQFSQQVSLWKICAWTLALKFISVWPRICHVNLLSLSFLIYIIQIDNTLSYRDIESTELGTSMFSTVPSTWQVLSRCLMMSLN